MTQPLYLKSLHTREAVTDALYRCVIGLDSNDRELFESAFIKSDNTTFDMGDGNPMVGIEALGGLLAFIGPLDTQHMISNVRVDIKEGAKAAHLTAYALAQHYRSGEGPDPITKNLMSGSRYFVDVVEDSSDGVWKIKTWKMQIIWLDGDSSIVGR